MLCQNNFKPILNCVNVVKDVTERTSRKDPQTITYRTCFLKSALPTTKITSCDILGQKIIVCFVFIELTNNLTDNSMFSWSCCCRKWQVGSAMLFRFQNYFPEVYGSLKWTEIAQSKVLSVLSTHIVEQSFAFKQEKSKTII